MPIMELLRPNRLEGPEPVIFLFDLPYLKHGSKGKGGTTVSINKCAHCGEPISNQASCCPQCGTTPSHDVFREPDTVGGAYRTTVKPRSIAYKFQLLLALLAFCGSLATVIETQPGSAIFCMAIVAALWAALWAIGTQIMASWRYC